MKNVLSPFQTFLYRYGVVFFMLIGSATLSQAQVKGIVFIDYDGNGKRTLSDPTEPPVEGVTVRLYVGNNNTPFVTQTTNTGEYNFTNVQAPADSMVRVEFSNFPETFSPSLIGTHSNTSVQFAKAPALSLDLGILNDDEYCTDGEGLQVATACYTMGDPLKPGTAADDPALIVFDYEAQGLNGVDDFSTVKLAKASQIGSTWIAAYQKASDRLMVGALVRRHVGLGPLGTGGLYYVDLNDLSVHNFLDVKTLGIDTGPDPHIDPITNQNILPASKTARSRDSLSFHKAGKVGLGGVQLSRYQDTLFLINLHDKKLYSFNIGIPLAPPASIAAANVRSYTIPNPNCSNGDYAPWALKYHRNKLYIGVVCTAETSQNKADLKGAVYTLNLKDYQFKKEIEFPLGYRRDPLDATQGCDTINSWKPWTGIFPKQCNHPNGAPDPTSAFLVNAQPILSDIEFDDDGSLIIGMMDRGGLQTGQNQPGIDKSDTLNYYGFMSGDLLRAQRNADGTYTMESNGTSGPYVAAGLDGSTLPNVNPTDLVKSSRNKNAGPGGGEFFFDDFWINQKDSVGHAELLNGGVFKVPGWPEVFSSAMDPLHKKYLATGFIVFDTKTGQRKRSFGVYAIQEGTLGKSGGVGDLTGVCGPAPLEIGNRIWFDADRDGIQDPNEKGLDGIIITLHDMQNGGVKVATDTSSKGGVYYFNDKNVPGGLKRNHNYQVRINLNQNFGQTPQLLAKSNGRLSAVPLKDTLELSPKNTTGMTNPQLSDSDAGYNNDSTAAIINVKTGFNSENDHNADIGLMNLILPASVGDYTWYDLNRNGIQDIRKDPFGAILGPELPAKNVIMELYDSANKFVKSDTTDAAGKYLIDNLTPAQYHIKFNPVSYPAPDFVVTDKDKGTNDSLDNDIERVVYKTANFTLASDQHDPRWDMGFFRIPSPEISDPCVCDSTILYFPGDGVFSRYIYRERVTIKATPGGKWAVIPYHAKKNIYTYGLYEDDGEGYVDSIDLSKKNYFFTEVPDSLGLYEFKFSHKSQDGYALVATDGVDTLSIGAICREIKEQYDNRLDTICANAGVLQLQQNFPNGIATYYFLSDSGFVFKDGFNEFELIKEALKRTPLTELDPKKYKPNSTITLYLKWTPNGYPNLKGACPKSIILDVHIKEGGTCIIPNDIQLSKTLIGDCRRAVGDTVEFTIKAKNMTTNRSAMADSIYVEDVLSPNFTFISASGTQGAYNPNTKLWGPLRLMGGDSAMLTIKLKINQNGGFEGGTVCNIAEVKSMKGTDIDSSPGNGNKTEDDYALACVSVPIKICEARKDTVIITAPEGYTSYQWFRNGVKINGATASTLEVGQAGEYSVEVSSQGCPAKNCCPAYVINDCVCPEDICVPFVIKQTKSRGKPTGK